MTPRSCVPSPKSQKYPAGLAIVPSLSVLPLPSKTTLKGPDRVSGVAMSMARGGSFVMVSLAPIPAKTPGMRAPVLSTKITLVIRNNCGALCFVSSSKLTFARILFVESVTVGLGASIVRKTVIDPFDPKEFTVKEPNALLPAINPAQFAAAVVVCAPKSTPLADPSGYVDAALGSP